MLSGSTANPLAVPRQASHGSTHSGTASLAFSDWLVDDVASPATEGSASDDLVSTSATTPEHTLGKPQPFGPSSYTSSGPLAMAWQSGAGTGRFTVDAGGTASAPGSAFASASTSPVMPSHFDQIRASAGGPMRSSGIAMPTAPSRHARHPSDAHADDSLGALSTSVGRSSTLGRRSRQGSQSGGALSQSPSMTSLHSLAHKPYARPAPLTPVATTSFASLAPWSTASAPVSAAPPSAGLSPILGPAKLPGALDDIGAIDFDALERHLPDAASAAAAPRGRPAFAAFTASAGATPPSRDELAESDSPEAMASADPLATKLWRFYAKAKHALPQGQRMENLSWRMGGMKLGQMAAERESSAVPSPASESAERGRSSKAHVSFDDDAMDIDWRAKSRSRSRAPNRDAMDLDFGMYGSLGGGGSEELDRFLSSLTDSSVPSAPSPAAEQPFAGLRAAFAADVAAHTPAPATGADAELAAILGMSDFARPVSPPPALRSRATLPPRAQTLEEHNLANAHPGGAMPRQSGSVPGLRNEEQLPSNQHHEYGFIPRLVRKTSFDGVTTPYFSATAGSGAPTPLSLSASATPGEMDLYAAVNATNWAMPTSAAESRPPMLRHSYSPSSFLPPGSAPATPFHPSAPRPGQASPPQQAPLARVPSADQLQMLQHMYQQQQAAVAMSNGMAPIPLQYPYAAFLAQHHARTALRLAAASNAFAAANGLPPPMTPVVGDPANATFRPMPMPMMAPPPPAQLMDPAAFVSPSATVSPWQLASGSASVANSPSPTQPAAATMSRQSSGQGPSAPPLAGPSTAPAKTDADTVCTNCKTSNTPLWRRDELGRPLCNGCGLFRKLHGVDRPLSLATGIVKKRNRGSRANKDLGSASASSSASSTPRKPNSRSTSRRTTLDHEELA